MTARTRLGRFLDHSVPWGTGLFYALVAIEMGEGENGTHSLVVLVFIGVAAVIGVALARRHDHPIEAAVVTLACSALVQAVEPETVVPIAALFGVGSLAAERPPRISLFGLAGLMALASSNFLTATDEDAFFAVVLAVGAWALGEAARSRRATVREEERRALADERAQIARELHDVIAHSVSVIVVQAAAADDVFDERPEQARHAIRSIERAGRNSLRELRTLLNAVRPGNGAPSEPQPRLERLNELAESFRAGGLGVDLERTGEERELPASVELSAYRIVQEALTNTLRHADATRAQVSVRYGDDALELKIRDDGRGAASVGAFGEGGGHGLAGMRERAQMLGGSLEAGPAAEGGYLVAARLPIEYQS